MKRSIIPFAAAALILFGCQEKPEPVPEPEAKLEVSPASISFDSSASEKTITITATQDWKAAVEGEGFSISSSAGKGNAEVKVSAGANESLDARKGKVTITSGKLSVTVELSQTGEKPVISIDGDSVEVPAEGGHYEINVKYNTEYSVEIEQFAQDWLHCISTRAVQEGKIDFVVDANESADERSAKVTISGKNASAPVNTITFTQAGSIKDPVLPGEFSVGPNRKVHFSKGNLQAKWENVNNHYGYVLSFATHQYDYIGNTNIGDQGNGAVVDLFGWPTYENTYGISISVDDRDYDGSFYDWGKNIDDGNTWRTLSENEWSYLINTRTYASVLYKCGVTVCGMPSCLIIAPDGYTGTIAASYDASAWSEAEAAGLVCLPAAGNRYGSDVYDVGEYGTYWSSSALDESYAYFLDIDSKNVFTDSETIRSYGFSVRLVTDDTAFVAVESVSIDRTEMTLAPSTTGHLYATVLPEDATYKSMTWTSSNTSVAKVVTKTYGCATINAYAAGTAVITVTSDDGSKTASCTVTVGEEKDPVLPGEFSVGDGYTVHFSSGNLRAKKTYGIWNWGFYEHQYDYNSLNGSCIDGKRTPSYTDDEIDLFTWGYGYWSTDPTATKYLTDYTADKEPFSSSEDWGAAIDDKGTWRTLTADEWKYLINEDESNTVRKNKVKTGVTVCDHTNCIILVPDVCLNSYSFDSSKTSYSSDEWETAEKAGLVCLPAAGMSSWEQTINDVGKNCNYWTSSSSFISSDHTGENSYFALASGNGKFTCERGGYRQLHYAVRLVTGAPVPHPAIVAVESVSIDRTEMTLTASKTGKLYATVLPEDATNKSVNWTSSNTSVAAVVTEIDGSATVYTFTAGTTIITVTTEDGSKTASCKVTVEKKNDSALPGVFSVSGSKKVQFSKGNLQAKWEYVTNHYEYVFNFAAHQYDYIGAAPGNTTIGNHANGAVVDLFGWSTYEYTDGISISEDDSDYSGEFYDWGKDIDDGNNWRTLSKDEWGYLLNTQSRMINGKSCYSNEVYGVSIGGKTYKGVFIYPDNYNGNEVSSSMTWEQINAAGIVFLPAAGTRSGTEVFNVGDFGFYWSSSSVDATKAYFVRFFDGNVFPGNKAPRFHGSSVRLITDIN